MAKKQYLVLGLGIFGSTVAKTLSEYGHEVLAVDQDITCVDRIAPMVSQAVQADMTNIEQLRVIGAGEFDVAIIGTGSDLENTLLAVLNLRELGVPYIVAKAKNKTAMKILETMGVDRVVRPEKEIGERTAKSLLSYNISDLVAVDDKYSIVELIVPKEWVGKSLRQLELRSQFGINVIGIRGAHEKTTDVAFAPEFILKPEDHLLVIAETIVLERLDHEISKK